MNGYMQISQTNLARHVVWRLPLENGDMWVKPDCERLCVHSFPLIIVFTPILIAIVILHLLTTRAVALLTRISAHSVY